MHSLFFSTLHTYKLYIYIYSRSKLFIIIYCIYYMCAYIYIYIYTYTYICVHVSDDYKHVFYIVFAQMHHGLAKIRDWVLRCTVNQDYIYIYLYLYLYLYLSRQGKAGAYPSAPARSIARDLAQLGGTVAIGETCNRVPQ